MECVYDCIVRMALCRSQHRSAAAESSLHVRENAVDRTSKHAALVYRYRCCSAICVVQLLNCEKYGECG